MIENLKNRLRRIREAGNSARQNKAQYDALTETETPAEVSYNSPSAVDWPGWEEAGFKTLKRKLYLELNSPLPSLFPSALAILIPDFRRAGRIPAPDELVFFDLETTGLSGGAGTIAFLAAVGRFAFQDRIEITQYLLLDYPGESVFIEAVVKELCAPPSARADSEANSAGGDQRCPFIVSYNGKCFDSQILKNRCLMNGIRNPEYFHADLLHPARRLWKRKLPDCSQATIETSVLGLDRAGDTPGALAPEIWFSFLRSGENRELLSICAHNAKDIYGLAALFLAFARIAGEPLESGRRYLYDEETLALIWQRAVKKESFFFGSEKAAGLVETGNALLEEAARKGGGRAAHALAIKAEWQLKDPVLALAYTKTAIADPDISEGMRTVLEKRRDRLLAKIP